MLKIGLTGGIGSGKSTVAKFFEVLGVPVYYADVRAKELMSTSAEVISNVKNLLGDDAYLNEELNRSYVANKVFNDKSLLEQLNAIVHPAVKNDFENWSQSHSSSKMVVQEAAILFENGGYKNFDRMVLVTAPEDIRIKRVISRDGSTESQVRERLNNQWSDDKKIQLADSVIINDDRKSIIEQVTNLIKHL
ncbi:dephospho-CoA kinase [Carboxylicivirga caseinilyticus]|uniref:dephospho-CoA kinase n=1 Tax=Carboxylicivirga caseinilyticus TaxID=3417572 RepID=UPI003D34537A|nr:dephospho-CoA kinase [Marinilabiliaceae bacterium A049]